MLCHYSIKIICIILACYFVAQTLNLCSPVKWNYRGLISCVRILVLFLPLTVYMVLVDRNQCAFFPHAETLFIFLLLVSAQFGIKFSNGFKRNKFLVFIISSVVVWRNNPSFGYWWFWTLWNVQSTNYEQVICTLWWGPISLHGSNVSFSKIGWKQANLILELPDFQSDFILRKITWLPANPAKFLSYILSG